MNIGEYIPMMPEPPLPRVDNRRFLSTLNIHDIVSVQPLSEPSGITFYLKYQYGKSLSEKK